MGGAPDDEVRVDTLGLLAKLRECLSGGQTQHCLDLVERVETSLVSDVRYSAEERHLVQHLRSGISGIVEAQREEASSHDMSFATLPLTALETSLRKRITGEDGWLLSE